MDVTLNNVLEGTRQYFLGLPKQTQADGSAQPVWSAGAPNHEEGAPAQSGAPAPTSRPPSAAAAPPSTPLLPTVAAPPRPPSEPLEPEPHIIHKATVMREAAEKRKEQPETEDDEEVNGALSPPSHIIHKPPPRSSLPSPAPAPAAPCPSPARPPSTAPQQPTEPPQDNPSSYRPSSHRVQSSEHFTPTRPPDPYSVARPPESYSRYHYETAMPDGRTSQGPSVHTSQPSLPPRHSPQTYARMSSSLPQHTTSRLREPSTASPPPQRYAYAVAPPPPHNDRVPPIHHPQPPQTHSSQRMAPIDGRPSQAYPPVHQRHEPSPYSRPGTHYDRMPSIPPRKYDHQQAYSGYRPIPVTQPVQNHRVETQQHSSYKLSSDLVNPSYAARPLERVPVPVPPAFTHTQEVKHVSRIDYPNMSRTTEGRSGYSYPIPSTSSVRFGPSASTPVQNSSLPSRSTYRTLTTAKSGYDYAGTNQVQTSPARSTVKPGYPSQQPRMTVSVTTLVNQMNQTKQKRESPLDLSVKTVKNSADSSTTQDDSIDSATMENKVLHSRASSGSRQSSSQTVTGTGYVASHKVDFAPDFNQYRERAPTHSISNSLQGGHVPARYNGAYDSQRQLPATVSYPVEARHQAYPDRSKYNAPVARTDYVQRIDLTRSVTDERHSDSRIRDDRHCIIEERKRPAAPIISNIPEKIVRYETWSADSRIERLNQSAREQQQLMSQPVYSYSSHKQLEAYQNEQKRSVSSSMYQQPHLNHRYPNTSCNPPTGRDYKDYHSHYHPERIPPNNSRHVIQKLPNNNELTHPVPVSPHSGVPANKRVLSILRNSLETKQTGFVEPLRPARQISELIVIDDADDDLEITDLTKDQDIETQGHNLLKTTHTQVAPNKEHHIQMPKAVDSIACDSEFNNCNSETKTKSPESDVSSRIRTKAELKVMPHDSIRVERKLEQTEDERNKPLPKSQKQHLFNQIREDLRLESVIKSENTLNNIIAEVKSEPMNIDEIEKDAQIPIKTEPILNEFEQDLNMPPDDDLDWASACDSFMEQLKTGCPKKKIQRKIIDSFDDNETKADSCPTVESKDIQEPVVQEDTPDIIPAIVIKQEPTEDNVNDIASTSETVIQIQHKDFDVASINVKMEKSTERSENYKETSDDDNIELIKLQTSTNVEEKDSDSKGKRGISQKSQKVFRKKHKNNSLKVGYDKIKNKVGDKTEKRKIDKKCDSSKKGRINNKIKLKKKNLSSSSASTLNIKQEPKDNEIKTVVKEESESTDDDVPLIKSKILKEKETKLLKEKENKDILNYKLLKDLSEKSAYVKLECCDVDMNKNSRKSLDSMIKQTDELQIKGKLTRQNSRLKTKSFSMDSNKLETHNNDSSSDSDDDVTVASRLRLRKNTKNEESKLNHNKTPVKSTSSKKLESSSNSTCSTPVRRPGFGDGSDFYPGWEEELYKYKRSLRMPTRLIAIPRGRSDGPFSKASGSLFTRGSTSLPDLDPAPLSPAPSSAPSAATDDIFARRQDKLTLDSDLESNSSYTAPNRLHYDSEASTSTNFSSSTNNKKRTSIVDVLIQKCGKKEDTRKKIKEKDRDDRTPKLIPKSSNTSELLPTPSLGLVKDGDKGNLSATKEKLMEEIYYLGAFRKETVSTFRNDFINNTNGLIGATEEFAPVMLKTRTRTESRLLKQRATIKEVFGDERPASAPPISCREEELEENKESSPETIIEVKKEPECKPKNKLKKIVKDKIKRRSNSTRDGLRSSNLKKCDAKGRLLRLKKRNNLMNTAPNNKRNREGSIKHKKEETKSPSTEEGVIKEGENIVLPATTDPNKRRFKRLFGRRKLSSGFDYIRKKKKIIRRDQSIKIRRHAPKPSPESAHDILKEIKSWIVKKSEGETHLHKAARLGYTDCVAYCLEKMNAEPSSKDNAGFTPLHVAAAKGHVRIARLLLQYGANVSAAAQGGIRPLHEACENSHVEIIRLLLSYGADPLLGTYAGQTPEELTDGPATTFLRLHLTDVQGKCTEPWKFPSPAEIIDSEELGCDSLLSPPPCSPLPPPDSTLEIQCTEAPLPPFYSLRTSGGQPSDGLWCLLQDITNVLQIKSKESLLKQIHCGSGSPKELLREIRTSEFLERAQCHQLLCAGEKVNVRASKVALVRVTDKLRQLLKIETVLIS